MNIHIAPVDFRLRKFLCSNSKIQFLAAVIILIIASFSTAVCAYPFPMLDARSAALGGVGVAADTQKAPFINSAVVATDVEGIDWTLIAPVIGRLESDPDHFEDELLLVQQYIGGAATDLEKQQRLNAVDNMTYRELNSRALALVIPSEVLGATAYFNQREFTSASIKVGDGTDDSPNCNNLYNTCVEHRSVTIREIGVAMAKLLDVPGFILDGAKLGVNLKLGLYQSYGYDETIATASAGLNTKSTVDRTGSINLDVGIAKEFGVWKIGIVVRDVFKFKREYGESGEEYEIRPQVRAGFGYQSRRLLWEIDGDVSENAPIGHLSESKYVAFGFEYETLPGWRIRLGVRQNQVGDKSTSSTAGMGFNYGGFGLDMAVVRGDDEQAVYSQFSMGF